MSSISVTQAAIRLQSAGFKENINSRYLSRPPEENSAFSLVIPKSIWERVSSLTPPTWESDVEAICERDITEIEAYQLEDITDDIVKYHVAITLLAKDPEAFLRMIPRLNIENPDQRKQLAYRYILQTKEGTALPSLGITSPQEKKELFALFHEGHLSTAISALAKIDIKDAPWLRKQVSMIVEKDLYGLGTIISKPSAMKDLQSLLASSTDKHKVDFCTSVLRINPWVLPIFMHEMDFKDPLKKTPLSMAWIEGMKSVLEDRRFNQYHEIRKPIEALMTGNERVDLDFLEAYAENLPLYFARNMYQVISLENDAEIECLIKAFQKDPQ